MRRAGRQVPRVLHRYDFLGRMVETLVVDKKGPLAGRLLWVRVAAYQA